MTPFKVKVSVEHYENMGYELKVNDILYSKKNDGTHIIYCCLIKFDEKHKCWLGKSNTINNFPICKAKSYIEIVVIPFEQYRKKLSERATLRK